MARQPPRPPNGVQFSHRRLKTSVQNPYETFTAPQFDTWVDDLTSTIRNALSGKARGKARDPREGAGLDGLRRLFAQPGDPEESYVADETYDQSYDEESEQQHAPQESMDLTQEDEDEQQQQQQEEIDFFSENGDEAPYARDAEADHYYRRESPIAADDDDQQETLDFDSIYGNGASQYETRASPTWSIEAEGNTTRHQDDGEYEEEYAEGDEYNEGEEYAGEGDYYYEENQQAYAYYQETQPAAPAAPEVLEIDDDDDEAEENLPAPVVRSASVVNEEEEEVDELDDEDKENTDPASSPSVARSAAYAYSPSYSRRTPLSSVRSGDALSPQPASRQATQPSPSPAPRPSQPEVFMISDDDDVEESQPTPAPATQPPAPVTAVTPQEVATAPTDQILDEFDLDGLQQLPTQAVPVLPEDGGMDLFNLADLETRAAGPSVADFLAGGAAGSQAAFDQDVAAYLSTAAPLDMALVDPAILAAELAAFDAGIDAVLQAQAQAATVAVQEGQAVELSEIERAATGDVASAVATVPEPAVTGAEDGPLEGDGHDEGVARDASVGASGPTEDAVSPAPEPHVAADVRSTTPPASPPRLLIPTTPTRERGEPLFMSPGELPVVRGEAMRDEPEKMSHPPTPLMHPPSPPALGTAGHELPHFLDRDDIEKDAPREAASPKPPGDDEVEKAHADAEEPEQLPEEQTLSQGESEPKQDTSLDLDEAVAHEMSVEEKKAFMQRDDVDPFSLMGDDSIVAPGAVETLDEDEEVDELEEDAEFGDGEADGVLQALDDSDAMQGGQETYSQALALHGDLDADASGESDAGQPEEVEMGTGPQSTNVSTPVATAASPAQQHHEDVIQTEPEATDIAPTSNDVAGDVEPPVDSAVDQQEQSAVLPEAISEPEPTETRESTQPAAESLPSAMEDVLALPSPGESPSIAATTPAADEGDVGEATSSKGRKSGRGRPLTATRSSARIARTQSSQQVSMAAPKTRTRPPNSTKSEASVTSASAGSSAAGSALSRESSVGASSTRGRRRKRDVESAHGSRESTVQPTARKIKGKPKGKGKGKAKQELEEEEEVDELAKDEEPSAPVPTPAEPAPERPPLLRTQTYRHYHGKKNAAAGATPTWASLKWNSILQPALALVRMGGGASSSATESAQEPPAAESTSAEPSAEAPASPPDLPVQPSSNGTAEVAQTDTKVEPVAEDSSAPETKLMPEVVVPHIADVVATSDEPSVDPGEAAETEAKPTGLHLDALPPALPSPALPSPTVPPPPVSTPVEAPRPRGHASRPSLVIQDSFMPESGHMTRSNCRFHKISIPTAPGSSEVVQFLTPACSITNRELMEDEGIIDCGVANDIDHARTVIELEMVSDEVLHVLRRLVGLEMLREGEVGFRIPDGETMESLRERMPNSESSIFHQYRKPQSQSKDAEGSSNLSRKKRKRERAPSVAASQASTLTDLEATDEEHDLVDTPASRTRSRMGPMSSSSPLSPADRRKRRRVEHEDEYKPTDADHAIEAEDDEEDYAELVPKPKKRGRKSAAAIRSSVAPSPADTTASTPLPAGEDGGDTGKSPGDEAAAAGAKPQKKAPRRRSRKRKAGVVDPAFKPSAAGASESESEGEEPARKPTKAKRGKKRAAAEEGEQQDGTVEAGSGRPPVSKKRKIAAAEPAGGETQN